MYKNISEMYANIRKNISEMYANIRKNISEMYANIRKNISEMYVNIKKNKKFISLCNVLENIYNILIYSIFCFYIMCINNGFFFHNFIFTITITFYTLLIDIYFILAVISKLINWFNLNNSNKHYLISLYELYEERIIIVIYIFLCFVPLNVLLIVYNANKEWMNKFILFLSFIIIILMIFLCYFFKFFTLLIISYIFLLLWFFFIIIFYDNVQIKLIIKKNQSIISLIISLIIYYIHNM